MAPTESLTTEPIGKPLGRSTEHVSTTPEDVDVDRVQWMPDHDDTKRPEFKNKTKYYLTLIGFALGNGNLWRIPSATRILGEGSFLLQYTICMFLFGLPTLYFELMIGQLAQAGAQRAFGMFVPILQGVGWAVCCLSFLRSVNYNMLNAYSLHYTIDSFLLIHKYTACENEWNSNECISTITSRKRCGNLTEKSEENLERHYYFNGSCETISYLQNSSVLRENHIHFASNEYFDYMIRGMAHDDELEFNFGAWTPIACLFVTWLYLWFAFIKKKHFLGERALYIVSSSLIFTVFFLIHLICLPPSHDGLRRLFTADFSHLKNIYSWAVAINESAQSLCLGMGGMVTLGSYQKRSNDAFKDALVIVLAMIFASFLACLQAYACFGILSSKFEFASWNSNLLMPLGQSFYFSHLPGALRQLWMFKFWQFIFYAVLFLIGISTMFGLVEVPIAALTEEFRWCRKNRVLTITLLCLTSFLLGLPNFTKMGYSIFFQMEMLGFSTCCDYLIAMEMVVMLIYGPRFFYRDIFGALGRTVNRFGQWISPYGLLVRLSQVFISPLGALLAAVTFQLFFTNVFYDDGWITLTDATITFIPAVLYSITFVQWPIIIFGAVKAVIANRNEGKCLKRLFCAVDEHPAIQHSVPLPQGKFFSLRPIEVSSTPLQDEARIADIMVELETTELYS